MLSDAIMGVTLFSDNHQINFGRFDRYCWCNNSIIISVKIRFVLYFKSIFYIYKFRDCKTRHIFLMHANPPSQLTPSITPFVDLQGNREHVFADMWRFNPASCDWSGHFFCNSRSPQPFHGTSASHYLPVSLHWFRWISGRGSKLVHVDVLGWHCCWLWYAKAVPWLIVDRCPPKWYVLSQGLAESKGVSLVNDCPCSCEGLAPVL